MVPSSTRVDCSNANNKRIKIKKNQNEKFISIQLFISIDSRANESESFPHNPFFPPSLNLIMLNVKKGKTHGCVYEHVEEEEKKGSKVSKILQV